jgi:hypothetical protein
LDAPEESAFAKDAWNDRCLWLWLIVKMEAASGFEPLIEAKEAKSRSDTA